MARRNKPKTPRDFSDQAAERRDREREIARLEAQGVTLKVDPAKRIISAYRSNVFNLLLTRGTITANQHDAAHMLCLSWAQWKGLDGGPEGRGEVVDGGTGSAELVTDRMIRAGKELYGDEQRKKLGVLEQLNAADRKLMEAFVIATVEEDRPMMWRGIVERVTAETGKERQAQLVVTALEALRCVYQEPGRVAA